MSSDTTQPRHWKVWPPGIPYEMEIDDQTLWNDLENQAQAHGDDVGLSYLGLSYTWKEMAQVATKLAGGLQGLGVEKGDRVLIFMQNCPQFALAFYSIMRCGAVAIPINPMNKAQELSYAISNSGAKVAIASADIGVHFEKANDMLADDEKLEHLVSFNVSDLFDTPEQVPEMWRGWLTTEAPAPSLPGGKVHQLSSVIAEAPEARPVQVDADDMAIMMYTSGTTGNPKACMHSNRTIRANAMCPKYWQDLRVGDAILIVVPMFHITGLVGGLLGAVYAGAKTVILPRWDRRYAAETIATEKVTHWTNIPTMVVDLMAEPDLDKFDLSSLRYIGGGGAAMPAAIAERLKKQFDLEYVEAYGLTETAAPTHCNPLNAPRAQCLGIPHVNTKSCILDTEKMEEAPVGELGEIIVAGPQVFLGYWKNPEATEESFIELNGIKWFRTGDLGHMDEDGYFYIADRLKRMINASGFKVWPAELEALMHKHSAVQEVCIIATKDAYRGQNVKAMIVLRQDAPEDISADDIVSWCRDNMAVYKVPRIIEFVDSLPKGATGKVLWKVLQAEQDEKDAQSESA